MRVSCLFPVSHHDERGPEVGVGIILRLICFMVGYFITICWRIPLWWGSDRPVQQAQLRLPQCFHLWQIFLLLHGWEQLFKIIGGRFRAVSWARSFSNTASASSHVPGAWTFKRIFFSWNVTTGSRGIQTSSFRG